ncbi:MAG: glycosyltransferase family 4 protein [Rhodospirillales bacterium]|nr:MAG: glycosyltransferase family 4 protein [Rhodospirillales bacterium]
MDNAAGCDGAASLPVGGKGGGRGGAPLRILTYSTLFPNAAQPLHGVFVENRLRHLCAGGAVTAQVVAPVPWFPSGHPRFGTYAAFAKTPREEWRCGLHVRHPRYLVVPKVGMALTPLTLYRASVAALAEVRRDGFDFQVIDAHYFYPDGVAAAMLGRAFRRPVTITARGTDLNLIPRFPLARRMIRWAAGAADGLITVCQALKDELVSLGVPAQKVRVLRNGVDLDMFRPVDAATARNRLGLSPPVLLCVGGLIERKRHDLVIRALPRLPGTTLLIAGQGPEAEALERLAGVEGVADRVRFLGAIPHQELRNYYSAADVMVLASSREGWANVLLESMACGTPVVATHVWGAPEVVTAPEAGTLVAEASPNALADAIRSVLKSPPPRHATRAYAERFGWEPTTAGQLELFSDIIARHRAARHGA